MVQDFPKDRYLDIRCSKFFNISVILWSLSSDKRTTRMVHVLHGDQSIIKTQWIHCIKMWNFERWMFEHQSLGNNRTLLPHPLWWWLPWALKETVLVLTKTPHGHNRFHYFLLARRSETASLLVQILGQGSKTCHKHHTSKKTLLWTREHSSV